VGNLHRVRVGHEVGTDDAVEEEVVVVGLVAVVAAICEVAQAACRRDEALGVECGDGGLGGGERVVGRLLAQDALVASPR
jgi:hypothetical protein